MVTAWLMTLSGKRLRQVPSRVLRASISTGLLEPATSFDDSLKWTKLGAGVLPMWVADMDFKSAEPIQAAVKKRAATGSYGYSVASIELKEAIASNCRDAWKAEGCNPTWLRFHPGLIGGLYHAARLAEGGACILPTPVYPPFLNAARDTADDVRHVDAASDTLFIDMERTISELKAQGQKRIVILWCSPHNPTGKVWKKNELEQLSQVVSRHKDVITAVCSDEVWSGLVLDDVKTPFISLAELAFSSNDSALLDRLIVLTSPSKTYNVAALDFAFAVIPNDSLRRRYFRAGRDQAECTPLGLAAAEAIFLHEPFYSTDPKSSHPHRRDILTPHNGKCEPWRLEVVQFLKDNRDFAIHFISLHCTPEVFVAHCPEASYLLWLDCSGLGLASPAAFFRSEFHLGLSDGDPFFGRTQSGFCRLNFACPRPVLEDGLNRLAAAVNSLRTSSPQQRHN